MSLIQVGMLISLFLFCSSAEDEYFPVVITSLLVGNISFFFCETRVYGPGFKNQKKGCIFSFFFSFYHHLRLYHSFPFLSFYKAAVPLKHAGVFRLRVGAQVQVGSEYGP